MKNIQSEFSRLVEKGDKHSQQLRKVLLSAFERGLQTVMPDKLIESSIHVNGTQLQISSRLSSQKVQYDLMEFSTVLIIGGGKATAGLVNALIQKIGSVLPCYGSINVPKEQEEQWGNSLSFNSPSGIQSNVDIVYASHPIPDENGIKGTKKIIELVSQSSADTLVMVVISGGGSALMSLPKRPITISSLRALNETLLNCGANIQEINSIRKHISDFKGGQLATHIFPRTAVSLIVSDVRGDNLDAIASGPTTHDTSTFASAWQIIEKYRIVHVVPESIRVVLRKGVNGLLAENPKQNHRIFNKITNMIIGSASMAVSEMKNVLEGEGFLESRQSSPEMVGEAQDLGKRLASIITSSDSKQIGKIFYMNSGECTVSIKGEGIGGRNQEILLALVQDLLNNPNKSINYSIVSLAFDGIEGNSQAAGALVDRTTIKTVKKLSLDPTEYLSQNNSYAFFKELEDVIEIGQTGTNVNDIYCLLIDSE